ITAQIAEVRRSLEWKVANRDLALRSMVRFEQKIHAFSRFTRLQCYLGIVRNRKGSTLIEGVGFVAGEDLYLFGIAGQAVRQLVLRRAGLRAFEIRNVGMGE